MGRANSKPKSAHKLLVAVSMAALLAGSGIAVSQNQTLLTRIQVVGGTPGTCPAIFASFGEALQMQSFETSADGKVVTVRFTRADGDTSGPGGDLIETRPSVDLPGLGAADISMDKAGASPLLVIRFATAIRLNVAQAGESSVVISNIMPVTASDCGTAPSATGVAQADGPENAIEQEFAEARRAITQGDYSRAVQLLTRILERDDHDRGPDARELLGVARERNGQLAHAKAEYETYLADYPDAEGAVRVQQRLAAILTAEAQAPEGVAATGEEGTADATVLAALPEADLPPDRVAAPRRRAAPPVPEPEPEPPVRGIVSAYYFRNEGSTVFTEFTTNSTTSDEQVLENAFVVSADFQGHFERDGRMYRWRLAGDSELDFANGGDAGFSLSRAYVETGLADTGVTLRFGRQSRNDGGILGRFDGIEASYEPAEGTTIKAVAGSPVESSSDAPYASEKLIFGVSATRENLAPNLDATLYAVSQTREGYTDRQAVGLEAQYQTSSLSVHALADFDVYFNKLALARLSGTWIAPDQSSFSMTVDQISSPLLSFGNALTGETETTLTALAGTYTKTQMYQMAVDKTAETSSLTLAYSRPLTSDWQFSTDASAFYTSGTPASGAAAAQPSTGTEFYGSVQLVGSNVLRNRDTLSLSLRFADAATSDLVLLDVYERFDTANGFRLKPRVQVGYRAFEAGGDELFAVPSVNMTYKHSDSVDFELEVGGRISSLSTPAFGEEANEVYITAGINRQF